MHRIGKYSMLDVYMMYPYELLIYRNILEAQLIEEENERKRKNGRK